VSDGTFAASASHCPRCSSFDPYRKNNIGNYGNQGLAYEYTTGRDRVSSDRFYCVNGRFYAFSITWLGTKVATVSVERVLSSFRLLNAEHAGVPQ
jgi:hypothetical protein